MQVKISNTGKGIIYVSEDEFRAHCDDNGGYCLACYAEAYGVEPDARKYECESCGEPKVYGAEECLLLGRVRFEGE